MYNGIHQPGKERQMSRIEDLLNGQIAQDLAEILKEELDNIK